MKSQGSRHPPEIIGWRELVDLPDFGITGMRVKIDTGARTSALHALDQETFERDGIAWVRFRVPQPGTPKTARVEAQITDIRDIRNTSGTSERRIIVLVHLLLGRHRWHVETSLTNRAKMEFDMILGRTAIRKRGVLVDPGHSYLAGKSGSPTTAAHSPDVVGIPARIGTGP